MNHAVSKMVRSTLAGIGLVGVFCTSASATTQCVYNKGAYLLHVAWYSPSQIIVDMGSERNKALGVTLQTAATSVAGKVINQSLEMDEEENLEISEIHGAPVITDEIPALAGRCVTREDDEPLTAVMSAVGAAFAAGFAKITLGALVTVGGTIVAVGTCTSPGAVACSAAVAGTVFLADEAISELPVPEDDIFYVGTPSTTHYVDTWGTVFEPVFGDGGPVPGEAAWNFAGAHDKGQCAGGGRIYHVRCEVDGTPSHCASLPASADDPQGRRFVVPAKALEDAAWAEVVLEEPRCGLRWNASGAHDKGCWNGVRTWHVRCETPSGAWSTACPNMSRGSFKGREMVAPPMRLPDRAWSEVKVGC